MKKLIILLVVVCFGLMSTDIAPPYHGNYKPILMTRTALENSVKSIAPLPLINPGKIYIKGNYIYIVEKYKGIHVINDTDLTNPVKEKFITIPGIVDLSIKDDVMFADNAVDLVGVDISDLEHVSVISRVKHVFPELPHPEWGGIDWNYSRTNRPPNTVIVEWAKAN